MTTAKNVVFIGLQHENCYFVGRLTFCVCVESTRGNFSRWGVNEQIFGWWDPRSRKILHQTSGACVDMSHVIAHIK